MARFEAHATGLAFVVLDEADVTRLKQVAPHLLQTFLNGRVAIEGTWDPLILRCTPSWASGHPVVDLPGGESGFEVDLESKIIGRDDTSGRIVENLTVETTDAGLVLTMSPDSIIDTSPRHIRKLKGDEPILERLNEFPLHESALRISLPDYAPQAVSARVNELLNRRVIRFEGRRLVPVTQISTPVNDHEEPSRKIVPSRVPASERPRVFESSFTTKAILENAARPRPPRKALIEVKKAVRNASDRGLSTRAIVHKVKIGPDLVRHALDHLNVMGDVFSDQDGEVEMHRRPDAESRSEIAEMITEFAHDASAPVTIGQIVSSLTPDFHPVWIYRALDLMVKRKQINFDGTVFWFRVPDKFTRTSGLYKVRDMIRDAGDAGISVPDMHDSSDLPLWLIKENVQRLVDMNRISFDHVTERSIWKGNEDDAEPRQRHNFRDDVREALREAGDCGLSRHRILHRFSDCPSNKVSIALNELIARSEAELKGGVYRLASRSELEFNFAQAG